MLRDFSLRDFGASLNTVESYTNESSQGKIGLCETVNKQKCTHLGMFLASETFSWHGIGTFKTAVRKGREGVSQLTGTPYSAVDKTKPVLVFSEVFKDKIRNANKKERNNENENS